MRFPVVLAVGLGSILGLCSTTGQACPFCTAVSQTFSEEMEAMDVVLMARLLQAPPPPPAGGEDADAPLPKARFGIEKVLKGEALLPDSRSLELLYFGEGDKSKTYLTMATDPPNLMWSTPVALSDRAREYVLQLPSLPKDAERLQFFQDYLEDEDEMLARDAYDEFANVPYQGVTQLKEMMHHDRLVAWVQDLDIPASRRRLYLTMLGVCGTPQDADLLETLIRSDDRKVKAGLDAMIACYLTLRGPEGMPLIEELFLKNDQAEYADTYAAIMAIRFHGTETQVIEKQRLVRALRHMLPRAELADLVIPDLARWEDWEVIPQLVDLFKNSDDKSSWVRVPVVNYLRACPLPEAKQHLVELAKIDPDAVRRAETFFPFDTTGESQTTSASAAERDGAEKKSTEKTSKPGPLVPPTEPTTVPQPAVPADDSADADADATHLQPLADRPTVTGRPPADDSASLPRLAQANLAKGDDSAQSSTPQLNLWYLWGVPMAVGLVLLFVFRLILGLPLLRFRT